MENKLGQFIRDKRKEFGITLRELSKESGISFSHLSKIERGEHMPSKETIETIADSLGIDKYELFLLAGHSTDSDMEFWRDIFDNLNPDWGIDKSDFLDKNGEPDILRFRNAMVHGSFDSQIYSKLYNYFFTEIMTKRMTESIMRSMPNGEELVTKYLEIHESEEEYDLDNEWYEVYEEIFRRGYEPKQLLKIIDAYEEMEKKMLDIRKEFVDELK